MSSARLDLDAGTGRPVAAVGEPVHAAGRDHDRVARLGDDRAQAEAEAHRALEHVEALLLLGMHVGARDAAVGRELELELEQLPAGVGRRAQELDALAGDGVVDDLSGAGHGDAPWSVIADGTERPPEPPIRRRRGERSWGPPRG